MRVIPVQHHKSNRDRRATPRWSRWTIHLRAQVGMVILVAMASMATFLNPLSPGAAAQTLECTGAELQSKSAAEGSYAERCGMPYDPQSGLHRCDWVTIGWVCGGPRAEGAGGGADGGGAPIPGDPAPTTPTPGSSGGSTGGGPDGRGPLTPTNLAAAAVTGHDEAVNPDGIQVSWVPGGGPESLGFNVSRATGTDGAFESLISIMGRSWFVDCNVTAGTTYRYRVSAWSEGPEFSFTTDSVEATATVTPDRCRSLVPPGPSGENEPSTDPLFESVHRDPGRRPATPEQVRIIGSRGSERLQWEMPRSARMIFQIKRIAPRNADGTPAGDDERWSQLSVTPGHQDLDFTDRGDGGVRFSFPVGQFGPGDGFFIQAIHPYSIPDEDLAPDARFSDSSRSATIIKPGPGATIPNFWESLGTPSAPEGAWIGSIDDWQRQPQFSDEFNGSGLLVDSPDNQWYFARNDGPTEISPAPTRDPNQTDRRAVLEDGKLVMSAGLDDGSYSYLGTADNHGEGYLIDPTNGVFVEASVRLDRMTPADNAWWAFWLMAPGTSDCLPGGGPAPGGFNAYDGHAETGVELDLFEFVPDLSTGFNQALFRYEGGHGDNCASPGESKLAPLERGFTYEGGQEFPGVEVPNYLDGDYHRLGLYYAPDCYAVYLDDELLWKVTEESHPGWITGRARQSIRLTWEIQNSRNTPDGPIDNIWTSRGGHFSDTALDRDPTVFVDFVNVWEKKESANGLCSGHPDPAPEPVPEPEPEPEPEPAPVLTAPTEVQAEADGETIRVRWTPGPGPAADGYDIRRNGVGYWTVTDGTDFVDTAVAAGQTFTYEVTPWVDTAGGDRTYGPRSTAVEASIGKGERNGRRPKPEPHEPSQPRIPTSLRAEVAAGSVVLTWNPPTETPAGYNVERNGQYFSTVRSPSFTDNTIEAGVTYNYRVSAFFGPPQDRTFAPSSTPLAVETTR